MEKNLYEKILQLVGEASMCWEPIPSGIFDSEKAMDVANRIMQEINKELKLQSEFNG